MYETLLALLVAHLVADFPLQPDWMIRRKRNPSVLALHGLLVAGTAALALGGLAGEVLLILVGTHLAMDAIKVYLLPNSLGSFTLDQLVHLTVIIALAVAFPGIYAQGAWATLPAAAAAAWLVGLCLLGGTIASLMVGAIVIRVLRAGSPTAVTVHSGVVRGIGAALVVCGLATAVSARLALGRNWGMPMTEKREPELVTSGPYRFVRHPIYSGILLGFAGTALATNVYWLIVFGVCLVYFVYSARVEEGLMTSSFPSAYPTYRARTKMLIPFVL